MKLYCAVAIFYCFYCVSAKDVDPASTSGEIVKQMMHEWCLRQHFTTCLKLDLARLVHRLSASSASYQIYPGVTLVSHNTTVIDDFPPDLVKAIVQDKSSQKIDSLLTKKLETYISSLTLNVKLLEPSSQIETSDEGRRKKNGLGSSVTTLGVFSGGTLMAMGLSALAALAGKALMTALLSLMLSAISSLKGSGDHKSTTYEIVTRPVVSHAHTHSAEIQHESHHGGHHAPGYGYVRNMHP